MTDKTARTGGAGPAGGRRGTRTRGERNTRVPSTRLIGVAVVAALAVIFIVQNRAPTRIAFFTAVAYVPLWGALTALAAVGLLVGYLLARRR